MRRSGSLEGYKYIVKTIPRPYYNYKKLLSVETTTIKNLKVTPLQGGSYWFKSCRAHHLPKIKPRYGLKTYRLITYSYSI